MDNANASTLAEKMEALSPSRRRETRSTLRRGGSESVGGSFCSSNSPSRSILHRAQEVLDPHIETTDQGSNSTSAEKLGALSQTRPRHNRGSRDRIGSFCSTNSAPRSPFVEGLSASSTHSEHSSSSRRSQSIVEVKAEIAARRSSLLDDGDETESSDRRGEEEPDLFDGLDEIKKRFRATQLQRSLTPCITRVVLQNGYDDGARNSGDSEEDKAHEIGMPVAFFVEEESYLPAAVEFDPHSKAHKKTPSRSKIFVAPLLCLFLVSGMFIVLGVLLARQVSPNQSPRAAEVRAFIGAFDEIEGNTTHQYQRALDWLSSEDTRTLVGSDPVLLQRFLLAYFYFETSIDHDWENDCRPKGNATSLCYPFGPNGAAISKRWLGPDSECDWYGVQCDGLHQVRSLEFKVGSAFSPGMSGSLPESLRHLPFLQKISVPDCGLQGAMTRRLSNGKHLTKLVLRGNSITGTLSTGFVTAHRSMRFLDVSDNHIEGSLPHDLSSNLSHLKLLSLQNNRITGPLPAQLDRWKHLERLGLSSNRLSSSIPTSIGGMRRLSHLFLDDNLLSSNIPAEIGGLTNLRTIHLSQNQFRSVIPLGLGELEHLSSVRLDNNFLTGSLPRFAGREFVELNLGHNRLEGNLDVLSSMPSLLHFLVNNNFLTGTIPALHDKPLGFAQFDFSFNERLRGVIPIQLCQSSVKKSIWKADCLRGSSGQAQVVCPCCTICCTTDDMLCQEV